MNVDPVDQGSAPDTLWTVTNTAEALPGVLTPLAWTFWNEPCEMGMRRAFHRLGVIPKSGVRFATTADERYSAAFCGRYSANVDQMRLMADAMPGTSANAMEEQLLGAVRPGVANRPRRGRYPIVAVSLPRAARRLPKELAALRAETDAWWRASVREAATADASRCSALLTDAMDRFQTVMEPHAVSTMLCQALYEQVTKLAATAGRPELAGELVTGGDVEEAALVADLWDVAHGSLSMEAFLERHGYHGTNEGQVSSRSWREDTRPLRAQLDALRSLGADASPAAGAARRATARTAAQDELLRALPAVRRPQARLILRLAQRYVPLREVGKAAFLQCLDVGRAASRRLGELLAASGAIDDPDDVALLTTAELRADVLPRDAHAVVGERRAQRQRHLAVRVPDSWTGEPVPIPADDAGADVVGDTLDGLGVSPGVYEGTARLVTNPDDPSLQPGEVLVCETTDPSWASLMFVAGALVIDIGGAVSHGAIVARELGVPCVIGTRRAAGWLRTGDVVRVDGNTGTVTRVKAASPF
ncbi:MAG TPA: PEP-utilizing enzyme [Acidimicrobiales bacterium]|nr:PEP-utilizing enzyme [Acidimicrobiales bacterium]